MARAVTSVCDRAVSAVVLWSFIVIHATRMPRFHDVLAMLYRAVESIGGAPVR